ncbi:methionine--tRNA ligase [Clostridia bacterium]|nr:methionine--tRNA ligase [Clostridia bacterium]
MSEKPKFYITTPIYYPSDHLHIGHCYTTVAADSITRYKKMRGFDTYFLTGTDEHGQKIERAAQERGVSPKEYVDKIVAGIVDLWKTYRIEYDDYIRTTDEKHIKCVQKIFKILYDKGDIYKGDYEGLYCTPCETFFTKHQLEGGKCPDCGRGVEQIKEEAYFFRLSKYQDALTKHIEDNPEFIMPQSRQNEMLNNFLRPGLEDLCVSRTTFTWGVPVTFDEGHIVYVWVDALSNYISALGYLAEDDTIFKKYWPADIHLMAKEIVRFHAITWPALLMALDIPLPKQIFGHGWLIFDGGKMSKSKGNTVDPRILAQRYGIDAVRYFLMREISFGQDGGFSNEALLQRINSDLANDLGNLLSRTVGMVDKYFGGVLPEKQAETEFDASVREKALSTVQNAESLIEKLLFSDALAEIWNFIRRMNKYTDETQPWVLAKDGSQSDKLAGVLYNLAESLRVISILIAPFMPNTPKEIRRQLNITSGTDWDDAKTFGLIPKIVKITKGDVIFPRIDIKKELDELALLGDNKEEAAVSFAPKKPEITLEDFAKTELKIGVVLSCEKVAGSDKLLNSRIKIGNETRTIVSGIAPSYTPETLIGKRVVVVTNLKPVKLRGILSEGMILAASGGDGNISVITADGETADGSEVS